MDATTEITPETVTETTPDTKTILKKMPEKVKLNRPVEVEQKWKTRHEDLVDKYLNFRNGEAVQDPARMIQDLPFLSKIAGLEPVEIVNGSESALYFKVDYPYEDAKKHYCIVPKGDNYTLATVFVTVINILNNNGISLKEPWALVRKDSGTFECDHYHLLIY